MKPIKNKIVVIGAGMVGAAVLNSLLGLGLASEIVLVDNNMDKAEGEALDASHTTSFAYSPNVNIKAGTYEDCKDAQIIVMTAGPSIKKGEKTSRMDIANVNVKVIKEVMSSISKYTKEAVIIIVTNPLDIITYVAQNSFDYPKEKIIGTGTLLDTARFRRILGKNYSVDAKNVHGYILGEHGESAFATWSGVNVSGIPVQDLDSTFNSAAPLNRDEVVNEVIRVGFDIVNLKGYTSSGIAMSVCRLVKAVLLNELSVLPVSTTLQGEYGLKDVALSIPCIVGSEGIEKRLEIPLDDSEVKALNKSADRLGEVLDELKLR